MKTFLISCLALSGLSSAALAAACAPREVIVDRLSQNFGEEFSGGGLHGQAAVYEVWTSPVDGSWTILLTRADGVSCVMATGTDWRGQLDSDKVSGVPS